MSDTLISGGKYFPNKRLCNPIQALSSKRHLVPQDRWVRKLMCVMIRDNQLSRTVYAIRAVVKVLRLKLYLTN